MTSSAAGVASWSAGALPRALPLEQAENYTGTLLLAAGEELQLMLDRSAGELMGCECWFGGVLDPREVDRGERQGGISDDRTTVG